MQALTLHLLVNNFTTFDTKVIKTIDHTPFCTPNVYVVPTPLPWLAAGIFPWKSHDFQGNPPFEIMASHGTNNNTLG